MKKISKKKFFVLTLMLWITDLIAILVLAYVVDFSYAIKYGVLCTGVYAYITWKFLKQV